MAKSLKDLLAGVENASEVEKIIKQNLKEMDCKLFVDDGVENIYVPKSRLDSKIAQLKEAQNTIEEMDAKLLDLKNNPELTQAEGRIKELEEQVKAHNVEVKNLKINNAFEMLAKEMKVVDMEVLQKLIDLDKVEIDAAGQVKGLKEQMDAFAENKPYLFGVQQNKDGVKAPGFAGTGMPGKPNNDNVFGSKTTQAGDFGKLLAGQASKNVTEVDADYYFKK
jgi:hypothetical protein